MCTYDGFEWLGIALELDKENCDIHIKFMHPHFPTASFSWPVKPGSHMLAIIADEGLAMLAIYENMRFGTSPSDHRR